MSERAGGTNCDQQILIAPTKRRIADARLQVTDPRRSHMHCDSRRKLGFKISHTVPANYVAILGIAYSG